MTEVTPVPSLADRVASASPDWVARRANGLSDRSIAWLFIAPTISRLAARIEALRAESRSALTSDAPLTWRTSSGQAAGVAANRDQIEL